MTVLWDAGGWLSPAGVHERLETARPVGYATVTTVLVRLWRKGRLERHKNGHAFDYRARQTREQFVAERINEVLGIATDRRAALAQFVEALSAEDRKEVQRRLGQS